VNCPDAVEFAKEKDFFASLCSWKHPARWFPLGLPTDDSSGKGHTPSLLSALPVRPRNGVWESHCKPPTNPGGSLSLNRFTLLAVSVLLCFSQLVNYARGPNHGVSCLLGDDDTLSVLSFTIRTTEVP
jgi:hypothetical protein